MPVIEVVGMRAAHFAVGGDSGRLISDRRAVVIGRQEERSELAAFLDGMRTGPAGAVLTGEPGIGKTVLWEDAVARAASRSFRVLCTRASHSEVRLSYAGLADLLGGVTPEVESALSPPQRTALNAALAGTVEGPRPPGPLTVCAAALRVVGKLAGHGPVLVAVDDLQWLDRASARVLGFVLRRLAGAPVGFLSTLRSGAGEQADVVLDQVLPWERVSRVHLGPFDLESLHSLLVAALNSPVPHADLLRIHAASGGNPWLAIEIGRLLLQGPHRPGSQVPIPDGARRLVGARLRRLSQECRHMLLYAAALTHPSVSMLEKVSDSADVVGLLEEASEAGIVRVDGDSVSFSHPFVASMLYADTVSPRRRAVHRRLAEVVTDPEECARHLAVSADAPAESVAANVARGAGVTLSRGAPDSAAELFERAADLTPAGETTARERRTLEAARCYLDAGNLAHASTLLERVAAAAAGPVRADALRLLGDIRYRDSSFAEARQMLARARADAGNDSIQAGPIELASAWVAVCVSDLTTARTHATSAVDLAESVGLPGPLADALAVLTAIDFYLGRGVDHRRLDLALRAEDPDRDTPPMLTPSFIAGALLAATERFDDSRAVLEQLRSRLIERGRTSELYHAGRLLSELELIRGNVDAAERYARECAEESAGTGDDMATAVALQAQAFVDAHVGRLSEARAAAEQVLAIAQRKQWTFVALYPLRTLGFVAASANDPAAVDGVLGAAAEACLAQGLPEPSLAPFLPDEIEALVALGELDRARALLGLFDERAAAVNRPALRATAMRCRGVLLAAEGHTEEALTAFETASETYAGTQCDFERGRALLAKGQVERRAKRKAPARASLQAAAEIFDRLGASIWADRVRADLSRVGGRAPSPTGLTDTERQVAQLAARGSTNKEIAVALFISQRTVEANLTHIYRKLAVRSRSELAATMARPS